MSLNELVLNSFKNYLLFRILTYFDGSEAGETRQMSPSQAPYDFYKIDLT